MDPEEEITLADAARLVGLHPATLRTQFYRGRLAAERKGRDLWVKRGELDRYLNDRVQVGRYRADVHSDATPLPEGYVAPECTTVSEKGG